MYCVLATGVPPQVSLDIHSPVLSGDNVILNCSWTHNNDMKEVRFFRDDQNDSTVWLTSGNGSKLDHDPDDIVSDYHNRVDIGPQDGYLYNYYIVLKDVAEKDQGRYGCSVEILPPYPNDDHQVWKVDSTLAELKIDSK